MSAFIWHHLKLRYWRIKYFWIRILSWHKIHKDFKIWKRVLNFALFFFLSVIVHFLHFLWNSRLFVNSFGLTSYIFRLSFRNQLMMRIFQLLFLCKRIPFRWFLLLTQLVHDQSSFKLTVFSSFLPNLVYFDPSTVLHDLNQNAHSKKVFGCIFVKFSIWIFIKLIYFY